MSDGAQFVTVDGRAVFDSDDGDRLEGLALAEWFGCDMQTPADPTQASGYARWKAIRDAHEFSFLNEQLKSRGK